MSIEEANRTCERLFYGLIESRKNNESKECYKILHQLEWDEASAALELEISSNQWNSTRDPAF